MKELLIEAENLISRINKAFYVDGTPKALRLVMAETKPFLAKLRSGLGYLNGDSPLTVNKAAIHSETPSP